MKIQVTEDRECCDKKKDLKSYNGYPMFKYPSSNVDAKFCVHCGQIWVKSYGRDAAGSQDYEYVRLTKEHLAEEKKEDI